jgi:uncharacterized protein YukE
MHSEIKLSVDDVVRVGAIINGAFDEMAQVATGIGGHADTVGTAYNGVGTATAMDNYQNLGRAGQALANALEGLSQDIGLTAQTGQQTDDEAHSTLRGVAAPTTPSDLSIAAQV